MHHGHIHISKRLPVHSPLGNGPKLMNKKKITGAKNNRESRFSGVLFLTPGIRFTNF